MSRVGWQIARTSAAKAPVPVQDDAVNAHLQVFRVLARRQGSGRARTSPSRRWTP
ncbi:MULTISPECIES: hypothetical protein [unclassified Streptomyces]|uniref:hypothetical protein n=1 Tax=unclassified Streptomyces TaxID=2593676 RepID=UPI00168A645C|nr:MULTISPECIES: hypothetical protein [unclassified Streptomyces]MBD3011333.1 hypothetical protein [Streptomyces sp. 5-10]